MSKLSTKGDKEIKKILDIVLTLLPQILTKVDVEKITNDALNAQEVKEYAEPIHKHKVSEIEDISSVRKGLANEDHKHEISEIQGGCEFVDKKIKAIPQKKYAEVEHGHSVSEIRGDIPISRIEGGKELKMNSEKEYAEVNHAHSSLKSAIKRIEAELANLEIPDYSKDIEKLKKLIDKKSEVQIIKKVEEPEEITFGAYLLVPSKLVGRKITNITVLGFDGGEIEAKVSVEVGAILKKNQILTVFPACFCRVITE